MLSTNNSNKLISQRIFQFWLLRHKQLKSTSRPVITKRRVISSLCSCSTIKPKRHTAVISVQDTYRGNTYYEYMKGRNAHIYSAAARINQASTLQNRISSSFFSSRSSSSSSSTGNGSKSNDYDSILKNKNEFNKDHSNDDHDKLIQMLNDTTNMDIEDSIMTTRQQREVSLKDDKQLTFRVTKLSFTNGRMETLNLDTSTLLKQAHIYARDLFFTLNLTSKQETNILLQRQNRCGTRRLKNNVSAILPRKNSIIISFGQIRAVITLDDILLFDAHNPCIQIFALELHDIILSDDILINGEPPELLVLETMLRETVHSFNRRLRLFEPIVETFLEKVDNNDITVPEAVVHQLAPIKDALQSFDILVKQCHSCLEDLLNNDDEMLALLLTEQYIATQSGKTVDYERHEHVEVLLGVYARQISNTSSEINYLLQRLQSKQEFVMLALAGYRNRMVRMNVNLGVAGLSIGLSTAVAGFFGMNLISGLEESPAAFNMVVTYSSMTSILIAISCLQFLSGRRMRKSAAQRLDEMETLTSALSDMSALDHTLKSTVERGLQVEKEEFRKLLGRARQSKHATEKEVDLLFDVFDKIKDGILAPEDFANLPPPPPQTATSATKISKK